MTANISDAREEGMLNSLVSHLRMARNHAIFSRQDLLMCKSQDQLQCDDKAAWEQGWIIFADQNRNRKKDTDEEIIFRQKAFMYSQKLIYRAFGSSQYVLFYHRGYAHTNGRFIVCSRQRQKIKSVIISITGRIRIQQEPSSGTRDKCFNGNT